MDGRMATSRCGRARLARYIPPVIFRRRGFARPVTAYMPVATWAPPRGTCRAGGAHPAIRLYREGDTSVGIRYLVSVPRYKGKP
jgi:hypothetical protein